MNEFARLLIHFVLGGTMVTLATHFGSKGSGQLAAFISMFPSMTVLTFLLIYQTGGQDGVATYARGFIFTVPPWILYVLIVYFLCSRLGVFWSLTLGVSAYVGSSYALSFVKAMVLKNT